MKKWSKLLLISLLIGLVCSAGASVYAAITMGKEQRIETLEQFIEVFNVDDRISAELKELELQGYATSDIFIGYTYLYHEFGTIDELKLMLERVDQGSDWETQFADYVRTNSPFTPRTFEPEYLEKLSESAGLTSDDIMIADRIAHVTGIEFDDLIQVKLESEHWREITARHGILYGEDALPRVQVTLEQLERYTSAYQLTEDQVVEALVHAQKLNASAEEVLRMASEGWSTARIYAAVLADIYGQS